MKKYLSNILVSVFLLTILVGVGGSIIPQTIHAQQGAPLTPAGQQLKEAAISGTMKTVGGWIIDSVVAPLSLLILKITSLLTMLSGGILNFVVNHTIVEMAANYKKISAISGAWGTVRDVANMGFIFILLYASIQMILGIGKDTRKLIVNIIIAALLINFSMFFTQVVIDASNIIALTFYHAIAPTAVTSNLLDAGLSNSLMAPLHLNTIWNMGSTLTNGSMAVIGIMGSVITLIAAFIFFAVALMLVIRYVVLILVLILSPIAFIGDVIPGASGYAGQWRKALFGQAFFAPVYMFLTWITIKLFNDSSMFPTSAGESWAKAFGGEITTNTANAAFSGSSVALVFNFVVIIVFLIATLILSKKVSDSAGQGINKLTSKALGMAGGATLGMAGRFGRNTVGRVGAAIGDSEKLKAAVEKGGVGGMAARLAMVAGRKTSKGSFDLRGTTLGGELDAGKAKTGGFEQTLKEKREKEKKFAESLAPSDTMIADAERIVERAPRGSIERENAQREVDRLKGVNDEEAKKRIQKDNPGASEEDVKRILNVDRAKDEASRQYLKKGLGDKRKEAYVEKTLEQSPTYQAAAVVQKLANKISEDKLPTFRAAAQKLPNLIRAKNRAAIAEIRKGKKPVKEQLEALLKEAGDIPSTPTSGGTTPPAGGAPAGGGAPAEGTPTTP